MTRTIGTFSSLSRLGYQEEDSSVQAFFVPLRDASAPQPRLLPHPLRLELEIPRRVAGVDPLAIFLLEFEDPVVGITVDLGFERFSGAPQALELGDGHLVWRFDVFASEDPEHRDVQLFEHRQRLVEPGDDEHPRTGPGCPPPPARVPQETPGAPAPER